jgi:hypothetical protein
MQGVPICLSPEYAQKVLGISMGLKQLRALHNVLLGEPFFVKLFLSDTLAIKAKQQ